MSIVYPAETCAVNFYLLVDGEEERLNIFFFKPVFRTHLSHSGFTVSMNV